VRGEIPMHWRNLKSVTATPSLLTMGPARTPATIGRAFISAAREGYVAMNPSPLPAGKLGMATVRKGILIQFWIIY
jgi:hypothetical protein